MSHVPGRPPEATLPRSPTAERFCPFVQPDHPIVGALFRTPPYGTDTLSSAIADLARRTRYVIGPPGFRTLDELLQRVRDAGDAPADFNCAHRACVMVSRLRAAGWSADDVFVATGMDRRKQWPNHTVHAWIAVRLPGATLWIDSIDLVPRRVDAPQLHERYSIALLFNDRRVVATKDEQRQALAPLAGAAPRWFIYGHASLPLMTLTRRPGFAALLDPLFRDESADIAERDAALIAEAERQSIVTVSGERYRAGRHLTAVPARAEADLRGQLPDILDEYVATFTEWIPRLRDAYTACRTAADFSWPEVVHTVVAGMIADVAVGRVLALDEIALERHGRTVVWAFEQVSAKNAFGVIWMAGAGTRGGVGQLWHRDVVRAPLQLGAPSVALLGRIAEGDASVRGAKELLYLRYLGLVGDRGGLRPTIPAFLASDVERLAPVFHAAASDVVRRVVAPGLARILDAPWWQARRADPAAHLAGVRLLLEYGTDRLVSAGLLPPFPCGPSAPPAWGRWLWIESDGPGLSMAPPMFLPPPSPGAADGLS